MLTSVQKIIPQTLTSLSITPKVLRDRILQFFGVGMGMSILAYFIDLLVFSGESGNSIILTKTGGMSHHLLLLLPCFFFLGIFLILLRDWSSQALQWIDLGVTLFCLIAMTMIFTLISPANFLLFPYLLLILLHAVLIPCRLWVQVALGITTMVIFPLGQILSYLYFSEVEKALIADGGSKVFWGDLILRSLEIDIVAAVSVLMTQTLYRTWVRLSRAQRLGNYIIEKELNAGGMGKLYVASHQFLCRPAALKVMESKNEDLQTCITRFEREVQLSSTLTHPNNITIFDYGHSAENIFYYAMELLEGFDLNHLVEKFGPLPPERTVYILSQICGALAEAHEKGIIHRDIKPSNLFLSSRGGLFDFIKVLDFGLAKEIGVEGNFTGKDITKKTIVLGTPRYLAPECVYEKDKIDPRTDIYMIGCVAYWLLTGRPPFDASADSDIIRGHLNELPKSPSEFATQPIPKGLERVILKCLEKEQKNRYQSAYELAEALSQVPFQEPWTQNKAREWWSIYLAHEETESSASQGILLSSNGTPLISEQANENHKRQAV